MKRFLPCVLLLFLAATAQAQIQVRLSFKRLQYIVHEPVIATMTITNLAGRDIELHDENDAHWFGFEITANDGRSLAPIAQIGHHRLLASRYFSSTLWRLKMRVGLAEVP